MTGFCHCTSARECIRAVNLISYFKAMGGDQLGLKMNDNAIATKQGLIKINFTMNNRKNSRLTLNHCFERNSSLFETGSSFPQGGAMGHPGWCYSGAVGLSARSAPLGQYVGAGGILAPCAVRSGAQVLPICALQAVCLTRVLSPRWASHL